MSRRSFPVAAAALLVAGLAVPALTSSASAAPAYGEQRVCAAPTAGHAACDAHVRTVVGRNGKPQPAATTTRTGGYIWSDLASAYNLPSSTTTTTVAVVDAYAHPDPGTDLAAYRNNTGLPPLRTGQLAQMDQSGGAITNVGGDTGWGQEEMLDLEMVSAVCPTCNILYVGAKSASFSDLAAAVNTAARQPGVTVISNSYGGSEFSTESSLASAYDHPGIAVTVSSGDSGYGAQAPAVFNTVVAVGGTHLVRDASARGWAETAWSSAGSGCSAYIQATQTWQKGVSPYCSRRAEADVSADADPATGVAVYDSYGSTGGANWYVFGGTSVAAPLIGGVYALSGNTVGYPAGLAYKSAAVNDVTSGSNTRRCRAGNLCTAGPGWDGPTGVGTPNGTSAF